MPILTDPATGMDAVKTAMTTAVSFMTTAFDAMTGNGYLVVFLAVTISNLVISRNTGNIIADIFTGRKIIRYGLQISGHTVKGRVYLF